MCDAPDVIPSVIYVRAQASVGSKSCYCEKADTPANGIENNDKKTKNVIEFQSFASTYLQQLNRR
jgi:hypothetical protein